MNWRNIGSTISTWIRAKTAALSAVLHLGQDLAFRRVSVKFWLVMVTLVLLVLGSFSLALNFLFAGFYTDQRIASLQQDAVEVAAGLAGANSMAELENMLGGIRYTQGMIALVVDSHGQIVTTSVGGQDMGMVRGMMGMGMGIHLQALRSLDLAPVYGGKTIHQTVSVSDGTDLVEVATPIKTASGQFVGALILSSPLAPVTESISSFRHLLSYMVGIAVIMATLFALFLSRTLSTPLVQMNRIARRMSQGEFSDRVQVLSDDEVGDLGRSLNKLAEDLDKHIKLLSREKEQLQDILSSIGDAVITLDDRGELVQANTPACDLWQQDANRKETVLNHVREALREVTGAHMPIDKDVEVGTQALQLRMEPLKEVEGQGGWVAVIRDVTAEHKQEKLRRELMAAVSHELRTPVHLIQGQLEALVDGLVPETQQKNYLELSLQEVERLGRLIGDLQEINRLEQGFSLVRESLDIGQLAHEVGEKFRSRAEIAGVSLDVQVESAQIRGDRDRLTQVLANLLDNSLRYTTGGDRIGISAEQLENGVMVKVSDTGRGIASAHLPHIWDSFFRGDKQGKSHMGLGLTIVKGIVEAHGGIIQVSSEQGKGTTFTIVLPV